MERAVTIAAPVGATIEGITEVVRTKPETLFGPRQGDGAYVATVEVPIGSRTVRHQPLVIELGAVTSDGAACQVGLTLHAVEREKRFPTFRGVLEAAAGVRANELRLRGSYRPPLGPAGAVGDALVGHRAADAVLNALLRTLAQRADAVAPMPRMGDTVTDAVIDLRDDRWSETEAAVEPEPEPEQFLG